MDSNQETSEQQSMDSIIQYIMNNDPNKYGNPPTSKDILEKMQEKQLIEDDLTQLKRKNSSDCSVCKDEFDLDSKLIKLPCDHYFHKDCIKPWLEQRNSCPTCRFELPTDDADYEKRKRSAS
jgi:E3 ubiquitin-protein ligase RNF115/126